MRSLVGVSGEIMVTDRVIPWLDVCRHSEAVADGGWKCILSQCDQKCHVLELQVQTHHE